MCCLTRDVAQDERRGDGGEVEQGGADGSFETCGGCGKDHCRMHRQRGWQAHIQRGREGFWWPQAVILEQLLTKEEGAVESFFVNERIFDTAWANARGWIAGFWRLIFAFRGEDDENRRTNGSACQTSGNCKSSLSGDSRHKNGRK